MSSSSQRVQRHVLATAIAQAAWIAVAAVALNLPGRGSAEPRDVPVPQPARRP